MFSHLRQGATYVAALCLLGGLAPTLSGRALATTTWYVAPTGNDSATCGPVSSPCKTIQYTVDTRASGGDTLFIGAGTYAEHLRLTYDLTLVGTGMRQTIVDGSHTGSVVSIATQARVRLANMGLQHGFTVNTGGASTMRGGSPSSRRPSPATRPL
jgi:hypothetical protein